MDQEIKPETWGRFELVSLLGTGGAGDVYKAYDPNLKRYIALKMLRHENPEVVTRFLREARAQAQVEHMHVCKIYESGEYEGHPYIAMQYIEGKTLNELRNELPLEAKIRIMKDVAMGLHAAHRQGLIHRDVKPTNVMVKYTEEGLWKPFVLDFGIAMEQEAPGLTTTGMVVGTPFYMSPEQAVGKLKILDRRSDIYSLGVTLYELLTGKVPFKGDTPVDVLMKIIEKDPLPIRKINPRIPVDIETIIMKCLEKDPNRRYGSAKELGEDLQRYLDGDPIKGRPATITYHIKRKLIKHKWIAAVIGIASFLIIVLFVLWLHTKWEASQRALIAHELGQEVEKIDSIIRYAHLLPLHNISREKNMIKQRIKKIGEKMKKVGKMGFGPGHYAMGRGFMALQEYNKAKRHLEKAWGTGYQIPEVAYERGRVLGELYLRENENANRIYDKELREARKKEIEKIYRESAVRFLLQAGQIQSESQEYIVALIAFYEKKFQKALTMLKKGFKKVQDEAPWLYKAKNLEGNIYLALGMEESNYDEAEKILSRAEEAYQQVIKIGESDIRGYIGLSRVLERKIMIKHHSKGGDLQSLVEKAITQCQKTLQIDPRTADVYYMKASIYRWLGRDQLVSGKNPILAFNKAITSAESTIELQPQNFEAYTIIGIINRLKGEYRMNYGQDPILEFRTAIMHFKKAIEINPNCVMAYNGMGNVYVRKSQYEMNQGKDSKASLAEAISNFEKALVINPKVVNLHNGLAVALSFQSSEMMARGQDPRPSLLKAVQSMKKAIKINPSYAHFYSNLGFVYMDIGRYELDYGFVPIDTVNMVVKNLEKAIEINPKGNEFHKGLVSACMILTKYYYMMGKNCRNQVSQALEYFERGLEVNPKDPVLYTSMAANFIIQARHLLDRGKSPSNIVRQVDDLLKKVKTINPKYYKIYVQDGEISLLKARWKIKKHQNPDLYFKRAEASLKEAEELNPKDVYIHLIRAKLNWRKAERKISLGLTAVKDTKEGLASVRKALSSNPNYGETYALKGVLLYLHSKITKSEKSRLADEKEARVFLLKAFEINRNLRTLFSPFLQK